MKKFLAGFLALLLVFSLIGCNDKPTATEPTVPATTAPTTPPTTEPPITEPYTQAAAPLREAQDLKVELTTKKEITALAGTFSSLSEQELILTGIGTDGFAATLKEDLEIGKYQDEFEEYFGADNLYVNVGDVGYFQGQMTAEDFMARFAPAVLLDESLYADVSVEESSSSVTLIFSEPIGPEDWALPQGATFLSASGTAKINNNGTLAKTVYTIDYIAGNTTVSMEVTAEAEIYDEEAPEAPKDADDYIKIDSIEAPRLFDTAMFYIFGSDSVSSISYDSILSHAAGGMIITQTRTHYTGTGDDFMAQSESTISAMDANGAAEPQTITLTYRDGQYTQEMTGEDPVQDPNVKAEDMLSLLQTSCSAGIISLDFVKNIKAEDVNGLIYLEMELDPEWSDDTQMDLSYLLFQDENFLTTLSSDYKTNTAIQYIFLDPATGFPLSVGTSYEGVHTIEGDEYLLSQESIRDFHLADSSTYTELTDKNPPETAPEEQATPLLYKVTGTDGQEMYLMGTIHIGDEKTGFLPDEVYAAFDACDALAVEADVMALEDAMEEDSELAEQIAVTYYNADGAPTKDLLEEELYNKAIKLLKASGDYFTNVEYLQPYIWSTFIENFYSTLGRLRSEKGMDMRLLMRAKEQGKKILEVESAVESYQMIGNFSLELQTLVLAGTVEGSYTEYCEHVQKMYDLWCQGDEAALREMLMDETNNMTEEELALYKEYNDAMIIKRNENMLEVAISYLESEETVFYAVGLAHLLQDNGLVDTLREAGYTVEQVIYS